MATARKYLILLKKRLIKLRYKLRYLYRNGLKASICLRLGIGFTLDLRCLSHRRVQANSHPDASCSFTVAPLTI